MSTPEVWMHSFRYDALDRVVLARDEESGSQQWIYDADGQLERQVFPAGGALGEAGVVVAYGYDARGLLTSLRDPAAGTWLFEADALGRPVGRSDPGGSRWRASFTPEGFVSRIDVTAPGGGESLVYAGHDGLGSPATVATNEGTTALAYDARSRVISASYPDATSESFTYDRTGHRVLHTTRSGAVHRHVVDAAHQLTAIEDEATAAVLVSFTHDGAGRRTGEQVTGGATTNYAYDATGALTQVTRTGGYTAVLAYDAVGSRVARTEGGVPFRYPNGSVEGRGAGTFRLLPGPQGVVAEIEATASGPRIHQLLRDAGQSVARVSTTEPSGATALEPSPRRFEVFGAVRTGSAEPIERAFAGAPFEGESGLLYMEARHYDPATGRFLQPDPLGVLAPETYAYASSNPLRFWDPTGLAPQTIQTGGQIGGVGLQSGQPERVPTTFENRSPLPGQMINALRPYFPEFDLTQVRIHSGIPWYVVGEPAAYTSKNDIYFAAGFYDPSTARGISLIGHEALHSQQYQELGTLGFRARYLKEYSGWRLRGLSHDEAYRNISLEREAFTLQRRIYFDLIEAGYPR